MTVAHPTFSVDRMPSLPGLGAPAAGLTLDEYRLVRSLDTSASGAGLAYLAHDTMLDRAVVVHLLGQGAHGPAGASGPSRLVGARALAKVQHPNLQRIYRVCESGPAPYLVTELVRGR